MSTYNKQIINNSLVTLLQIIVVSISTFYLYRYIILSIGIDKLGLWSLILSVTSLANIGNFGFTGSLVKFTAELSTKGNYKTINAILNASILSVILVLMVLLSIIYLIAFNSLGFIIDEKWIPTGRELLFFAIISLFINIIASLYYSIIEGLNMAYLRAYAFMFSTVLYVIISVLFIEKFDLIGLAYAQLIQALVFLLLGIILSKRYVPQFRFLYFKWHKDLMIKVYSYGFNFQVIGIAQMLYDPITKAVLSKYGGLDFVAIFELATKLVKQIRALTSGVIQTIVPKIVKINVLEQNDKLIEAYKKVNNINLILTFITLLLIIPLSKVISLMFLDNNQDDFIIVLIGITLGWFVSSISVPAYMVNLGTGDLKWNVIAHLLIGILNLLFCVSIGYLYNSGIYIILSWVIALIIGNLIILIEFHNRKKIGFRTTFNSTFFKLLACFVGISVISFYINLRIDNILYLIIIHGVLVAIYYSVIFFKIRTVRDSILYIYKQRNG
jgi:O-antigen/teichoic acid export membrane protein